MAGTINDLYLKYVNKVGKTLENDRYFQYLFEMVQAGSTTLQQNHTVLHKQVDERWLGVIEESLDALNRITEHPRRFVTSNEEVVPVALARKITADSVRHLSMNTQFIASSKDGEIQPTKILNVTVEETYDLYENRFIYHLIQRLVTFIDKRTDVIFWSTGDETCNTLQMHSKVDDAYEQIEYKLEMKVKNTQSFAENDSDNMSVFMRIDRVRRMVMALRTSAFCDLMKGCARVRSPIQRTNTIMKDPDYRVCYRLWQFLESYDEVGYSIEEQDTPLEFDEEYQIQLFSNLITNYTVFKSLLEADPRKLAEETARRQALEAQLADSEKAFQEYRWQAEFQRAEAERQAEDRLEFTKQKAEKEKQELLSTLEKEKQNAAEALTKEQEKAARKEAQWNAEREKAAQAAADALNQEKERASRREADLNAAMEAQAQAAAKTLAEAKEETTRQADAHQAAMEAEKKAAQDAQAALQAQALAREQTLKEEVKAAQDDAFQARYKRREITAALKRAEAALKAAQEQLEQTKTAEQAALAREQEALDREQKALEQARQAENAREEAQARLEENTLARRLVDAFTNRRNPKRDAAEGEKSREEEEIK